MPRSLAFGLTSVSTHRALPLIVLAVGSIAAVALIYGFVQLAAFWRMSIECSALSCPSPLASDWIKEGKGAIKWTRLSCRTFAANAVRLQLHALAYNLGNFLRTLATPEPIKDWSLTSLKDKLIKIGAKVVSHGRYVIFQMAEVAIARQMFQEILRLIAELRPQPPPALA